jgi:hypothetical protein
MVKTKKKEAEKPEKERKKKSTITNEREIPWCRKLVYHIHPILLL